MNGDEVNKHFHNVVFLVLPILALLNIQVSDSYANMRNEYLNRKESVSVRLSHLLTSSQGIKEDEHNASIV